MLRLLLYLIIIYAIFNLIKNTFRKPPEKDKAKTPEGEDMVLDPECNTYIPRNRAISGRVRGEKVYFCSEKCLERYRHRKTS